MNFYGMRNKFVIYNNGENEFFNGKEWMTETPKDIRADAIKSCISAHKSAFTNLRNKNIAHFQVNYKSKKKPSYSIAIPLSNMKMVVSIFTNGIIKHQLKLTTEH